MRSYRSSLTNAATPSLRFVSLHFTSLPVHSLSFPSLLSLRWRMGRLTSLGRGNRNPIPPCAGFRGISTWLIKSSLALSLSLSDQEPPNANVIESMKDTTDLQMRTAYGCIFKALPHKRRITLHKLPTLPSDLFLRLVVLVERRARHVLVHSLGCRRWYKLAAFLFYVF